LIEQLVRILFFGQLFQDEADDLTVAQLLRQAARRRSRSV
jgi:hypothetical protein